MKSNKPLTVYFSGPEMEAINQYARQVGLPKTRLVRYMAKTILAQRGRLDKPCFALLDQQDEPRGDPDQRD